MNTPENHISSYLLKLRRAHPFLATISLFCHYRFSAATPLFETDGKTVTINPDYFRQLSPMESTGLFIHLTLHTALLHPLRRGPRDPLVWNIASDIVCNNIIIDTGLFDPPRNTAIAKEFRELCAEQVYEELMHTSTKQLLEPENPGPDIPQLQISSSHSHDIQEKETHSFQRFQQEQAAILKRLYDCHPDLSMNDNSSSSIHTAQNASSVEQYWRSAFRKAKITAYLSDRTQGRIPQGLLREIDLVFNPILDWRWLLWHYVVKTPSDFSGFDRRFIHQGLYLDNLESDSLKIIVAIDTSASIHDDELEQFTSELQSILTAYPFIDLQLYYVDADIYGPYSIASTQEIPPPLGAGGTVFSVFFDHIMTSRDPSLADLVVYFTDGYGFFPDKSPDMETVWVVVQGGLKSEDFPFGKVIRMAC